MPSSFESTSISTLRCPGPIIAYTTASTTISMSSANLTLTQKWLRGAASPYQQEDRVYLDVDAVLATYPTLRPKTDVYSESPLNGHRFDLIAFTQE